MAQASSAPRFYLARPLGVGQSVVLPEATLRHALKALRLRPGDQVTLFNGEGGEFQGRLTSPEGAAVEIDRFVQREVELPFGVTLAQGLPEGDKMDWIVEKATELGGTGLVPLELARSVVRLKGERALRRRERWQALAVAASEQCGRNRLLDIEAVTGLSSWLAGFGSTGASGRYLLAPGAALTLAQLPRPAQGDGVVLVVGPEGGFTAEETALLEHAQFVRVSLGERVLRTETAGLVALAGLAALWA